MSTETIVNRREFLKATTGSSAAYILGFCLPGRAHAESPSGDEAAISNRTPGCESLQTIGSRSWLRIRKWARARGPWKP